MGHGTVEGRDGAGQVGGSRGTQPWNFGVRVLMTEPRRRRVVVGVLSTVHIQHGKSLRWDAAALEEKTISLTMNSPTREDGPSVVHF